MEDQDVDSASAQHVGDIEVFLVAREAVQQDQGFMRSLAVRQVDEAQKPTVEKQGRHAGREGSIDIGRIPDQIRLQGCSLLSMTSVGLLETFPSVYGFPVDKSNKNGAGLFGEAGTVCLFPP
jgi:hypothetical protein